MQQPAIQQPAFLFTILIFALTGCSSIHPLVETPNIYLGESGYQSVHVPRAQQTTTPTIFYVTDRMPSPEGNEIAYGAERSSSMAFGEVGIAFGKNLSWQELTQSSSESSRNAIVEVSLREVREIARFPETPLPFTVKEGAIIPNPESTHQYQNTIQAMTMHLQKQLDVNDSSEIILFIHGFNNNFTEAALAMADLWHFVGRKSVPLFYSWPAANGGMFGYFKDRESGEFSIFHLKETLRILSGMEGVERIHIIAHSRGTDITTTALRELVIEARASGNKPLEKLKIANLILAAPDLDFGIVRQRLFAEQFGPAIGQITVYMNQTDSALGISQYLSSGLRFGKLGEADLHETDKKIFEQVKNVNFVNVEGVSGLVGHNYYRTHPGVLSDIAITLTKGLKPGETGRPLIHDQFNFWILEKDYPGNLDAK